MSDQPESGTVAETGDGEAAETPDADANSVPLDSEHAGSEPHSHEAKKYRLRLREAETKLANMQRTQIDSAVTAAGIRPAAVWATAKLEDLIGDDGVPDPEKIKSAVATAKETLGITDNRPKPPARGLTSGATVPREPHNSWKEAFSPRR